MRRPPGHPALAPFGTTIFAEMSALALEHDAVNLGQGFPDSDGPEAVLEAARQAIAAGRNQYPPGPGVPELLDAIAAHQQRFYGLEVDPRSEVLVTVGATEAIAATILALVQPGDEVVTFEPYYDSYAATIALAGGVRRTSVLRFPDFELDEDSLRAAFSPRTRLVLLNTPHNPTGKVFSRDELDLVCALAREHDAWVVTDEVYEHLVFDGLPHIPVATLPEMWDRTITISSAGKTFSTTGWKVAGSPDPPTQSPPSAGSNSSSRMWDRAPSSPPLPWAWVWTTRRMPRSPPRSRPSATYLCPGCGAPGCRWRCHRARTSSSRTSPRSA